LQKYENGELISITITRSRNTYITAVYYSKNTYTSGQDKDLRLNDKKIRWTAKRESYKAPTMLAFKIRRFRNAVKSVSLV